MSRFHFRGKARDVFGNALPNLNVTIKTTTGELAKVYLSPDAIQPRVNNPHLKSGENGDYELWLDLSQYPQGTEFEVFINNQRFEEIDLVDNSATIPITPEANTVWGEKTPDDVLEAIDKLAVMIANINNSGGSSGPITVIDGGTF